MRALNIPLPVIAALLVPQMEAPHVTGPGYVAAALGGAWLVLWWLEKIGRLPGGSGGERRGHTFGDRDRARLDEVHKTVTREDAAKPGWPMVWAPADEVREIRDLVRELVDLKAIWQDEREVWKRERARMEERITHLEDSLRARDHARERAL